MNLHIEKKLQKFHSEIFDKQLAYINQTQQSMVKTIASLMQVMDQTSTWKNHPIVVSPTHVLSHA
jgi:dihydroorotase